MAASPSSRALLLEFPPVLPRSRWPVQSPWAWALLKSTTWKCCGWDVSCQLASLWAECSSRDKTEKPEPDGWWREASSHRGLPRWVGNQPHHSACPPAGSQRTPRPERPHLPPESGFVERKGEEERTKPPIAEGQSQLSLPK